MSLILTRAVDYIICQVGICYILQDLFEQQTNKRMASRYSERKTRPKDKTQAVVPEPKRKGGVSTAVAKEGKKRGQPRRIPPSRSGDQGIAEFDQKVGGNTQQGSVFGTLRPPAFTINLEDEDASLGGGGGDDKTIADILAGEQQTPMEENAQSMNEDGPVSSRTRSRRQSLSQEEEMGSSSNLSIPGLEQVPGSNPGLRLPGIRQGQVASIIPIFSVDKPPQQPSGDQKDDMLAASPRNELQRSQESFELDVQRTYATQIRDQILLTLASLQLTPGIPEATKTRLTNIRKTIPENALPGTETEQKALLNALYELRNEVTRASINEGTAVGEKRSLDEKLQKALAADSDCQKNLKQATDALKEAVRRSNEQKDAKDELEKDLKGLKEMTKTIVEERNDFETKFNECSAQAQRLENDIKNSQKRHENAIGELDQKLAGVQQDLANCQNKNGLKDGLLAEKDQQIQQLTNQLKEAKGFPKMIFKKLLGKEDGTILMVTNELDKRSNALTTANRTIRQLQEEIAKLVVQVPTDKQRNAGTDMVRFQEQPPQSPESKQVISAPSKDVVRVPMGDDDCEKRLEECQKTLEDAKAKLTNAEGVITRLGQKVEKLSAQLVLSTKAHSDVKNQLKECEFTKAQQETELARLKSETNTLLAEIGKLQGGSSSVAAQRDLYKSELAAKDGRIKDLEQEIQRMQSGLRSAMDDASKGYDAAQDQYDAKLAAKDREIEDARQSISGLESKLASTQANYNSVVNRMQDMQSDNANAQQGMLDCQKELKKLELEKKDLEDRMQRINNQRQQVDQKQNDANNAIIKKLEDQIKSLKDELNTCVSARNGLWEQLQECNTKNGQFFEALGEAKRVLDRSGFESRELRQILEQKDFIINVQRSNDEKYYGDMMLRNNQKTICNWIEEAMRFIGNQVPSVYKSVDNQGMLLFYIHALCAEQHWGYLVARYMGRNYSMMHPLADQIALLLYEQYNLKPSNQNIAMFSATTRHNVIRVLNAFMRVFDYHKRANELRTRTQNNKAVLKPNVVKLSLSFDDVPDMIDPKGYALEMRKDIMRAHKLFFKWDLDTSNPVGPIGWNTYLLSFTAAKPNLPLEILGLLNTRTTHDRIWQLISRGDVNLARYWRYDVSDPLVLLLPMWNVIQTQISLTE
jgi:septal ring factor EnvC (AmiA/AmiB activator)